MNPSVLVCIIAALFCGSVAAQSGRKSAVPKRAELFSGAEKLGSSVPRVDLLPKTADIEAFGNKLSARKRNVDPFGLATFPREEDQPIIEDDMMRLTQRVTLNQALQTLKINGVNLKHKQFLIGGRNACEGDVIELAFKSEIFQAQVVEVGVAEIQFRDLQRQETGVLKHSVIPHLEIEPLQDIASRFESRMTPMETPTSPQR